MQDIKIKSAAFILTFIAATTVFTVGGCFRYEQTVVLNADGTADVTISYSVPAVVVSEDRTSPVNPLPDAAPAAGSYIDEAAALKSAFRRFGIEVTDASVAEDGDFQTYTVSGTVADAGALGSSLPFFDKHETGYKTDDDSVKFSEVIENELSKNERPADEEKPLLEALFPDCGFTFRVVMPGPVKKTNGTVGADGRTVEWRFGLAEFLFNEKIEMSVESGIE
jgi:hypothetical protein